MDAMDLPKNTQVHPAKNAGASRGGPKFIEGVELFSFEFPWVTWSFPIIGLLPWSSKIGAFFPLETHGFRPWGC